MSGVRWKSWQQMERAIERAADASAADAFVHPGEAIDAAESAQGEPLDPVSPMFGEIFRRMMAALLPPRTYGDERRWRAGYHRMCAFCYRISPEMFENATREEIAAKLGISLRAFGKQLEYVDAILEGRTPPAALMADVEKDEGAS